MRGRVVRLLVPALVAGATLWAFAGGLDGSFLWDDGRSIVENPYVHHLGPMTVSRTSRPLVQLSFALDYAAAGLAPRRYHVVNLAVHVLAALVLYALARRGIARGPMAPGSAGVAWLAGAIAALWAVHPLQTESVTYVVQRSEAMAGLFGLIVLYALDRAASPGSSPGWTGAAFLASLAAMASKPVAVAIPVVALLYDRALFSGSVREALRRRPIFHGSLAATWLLLPILLSAGPGDWRESSGGAAGVSPLRYGLTQLGVVTHYLRLVVWPRPLVLDYGWPVARGIADVWPGAIATAALLGVTVWGLLRRRIVGFLGAAFCVLLAPTSSLYPVDDAAFEHRMYLALAPVVAGAVLGAWRVGRGRARGAAAPAFGGVLALALVIALGLRTRERNRDYRTPITMWALNSAQRPDHPRPRIQLGTALAESGRLEDAVREYQRVLREHPREATALADLGAVREQQGAVDEAMDRYAAALQIDPRLRAARNNLGVLLGRKGRLAEAIVQLEETVRRHPDFVEAHYNLALALRLARRPDEARRELRAVLALDPDHAPARRSLERLDAAR
jgi:Tfp pilus assembly protein PilF